MNKKFFVPFETAKLCMDKGYSGENDYFWGGGKSHLKPRQVSNHKCGGTQMTSVNNTIVYGFENRLFDDKCFVECTAPTYHEVLDWLEKKGYPIESACLRDFDGHDIMWVCGCGISVSGIYPTREEAFNDVIIDVLKML